MLRSVLFSCILLFGFAGSSLAEEPERRFAIGRTKSGAALFAHLPREHQDIAAKLPRVIVLTTEEFDEALLRNGHELSVAAVRLPADVIAADYPPKGRAYHGTGRTESERTGTATRPGAHYLWRWIGMHAADLVIIAKRSADQGAISWRAPEHKREHATFNEVSRSLMRLRETLRAGDVLPLTKALTKQSVAGTGRVPCVEIHLAKDSSLEKSLRQVLAELSSLPRSASRKELVKRDARSATEIAKNLSRHYGRNFGRAVYIESVALIGRSRLAQMTQDKAAQDDIARLLEPFLSGSKPSLGERVSGSDLSGHLAFSYWAKIRGDERAQALAQKVADLGFADDGTPLESMPAHSEMSDALFMGGPILAEVGALTSETRYFDQCIRHLRYMRQLVLRDDGIYRHSPLDPSAWGRGNGFPALGLSLCLSSFPREHPQHGELLSWYRTLIESLAEHQDVTGAFHQIIDEPTSYREFSSTCMIAFSILRGLREGWLERERFDPIADRAWRAIRQRISESGELVDVCTGTGKQKSRADYFARHAILGRDARGGAMALLVSTERLLYERGASEK